jgi:putative adenylate-forming enzyme
MMDNFGRANGAGIGLERAMAVALRAERDRDFRPTLGGYTVGLSSGTSGHRGLFLASPFEQAQWAGAVLARVLHGLPWAQRVAFCLRSFSRLYAAVESPFLRLRYFDIATEMSALVAGLNGYDPTVLVAPPSLLRLLAEGQGRGNLRIRPARVISVAEVLDALDRKIIETAFAVRVDQVYQCTEGFLAASCPHGSLHLQEDIVVVQEVDLPTDGTPGEVGVRRIEPIVTDLWRRTQPIIRYRLNDILWISERPCSCGCAFRVIARIEGRRDDMFLLRTRAGSPEVGPVRHIFADSIRTALLAASPAIRGYHVLQDAEDHWLVSLELEGDADFTTVSRLVRRSLVALCERLGCEIPRIDLIPGAPTPRDARGKLRRVERRWNGR